MVTRKLSSFDLCSVAVPTDFDPDATTEVVAAVGSGPHSPLAAAIALRIGHRLGVPARGVYAHGAPGPLPSARRVLPEIVDRFPALRFEAIQAPSPADMVDALAPGTLLVIGAPGGSWFQRQFFGPGARIRHRAPSGTIVVKAAPRRVYQAMEPPQAYGPQMRAGDAVALGLGDIVVAANGALVGIVSSAELHRGDPGRELAELVSHAPHLEPDEPMDHAVELFAESNTAILPVVDRRGRLVGVLYRDGTGAAALPWAG